MSTKHFLYLHFNLISICTFAILIIALSINCNNPESTKGDSTMPSGRIKPGNYVSLEIRFQPNTDEERRDKSIKAIEKMLLNSVTPLMKDYKDYHPSMRVTWTPTTDTLHYWVDVINTYGIPSKPMSYTFSRDTTPDKPICPPCPTANPCQICQMLVNYSRDNPAYGIASISIDTTSMVIMK